MVRRLLLVTFFRHDIRNILGLMTGVQLIPQTIHRDWKMKYIEVLKHLNMDGRAKSSSLMDSLGNCLTAEAVLRLVLLNWVFRIP